MGFFGKIKGKMKEAAAAHKKDDKLVEEISKIYAGQGYKVGSLKKKPAGMKTKKDGSIKKVNERYSFSVTTGAGQYKISTSSEFGVLSVKTKVGGAKGKKAKFKVNDYIENKAGKLTLKNGSDLATKVLALL